MYATVQMRYSSLMIFATRSEMNNKAPHLRTLLNLGITFLTDLYASFTNEIRMVFLHYTLQYKILIGLRRDYWTTQILTNPKNLNLTPVTLTKLHWAYGSSYQGPLASSFLISVNHWNDVVWCLKESPVKFCFICYDARDTLTKGGYATPIT